MSTIMSTTIQTTGIIADIQHTAADLLQALSRFTEANIDRVPFEGSWSGGQVAEHLLLSCSPEGLYGPVQPTERDPDEKIALIKGIFLDFDAKYSSPGFIIPRQQHHEQAALVQQLTANWQVIEKAAGTLDLTASVSFDLPGFGILTRLELVYLMVYHTQRHTRQLNHIASRLALPAVA